MQSNKITSKVKKGNLLILIIGGIVALLISYFLIKNAIADEYIQIAGFILGGIFGLMGVGCLLLVLFIEKLVFENGKLKIYSLTGRLKREIRTCEIESYKEIEKENKHSKWKDLTIFTKDSKCTISSSSHSNYELLKKELARGKKKNSFAEKMWHYKIRRRYGIGFSIFGLIFLSLFGRIHLKDDVEVLQDQLAKIEGIVVNNVEVKTTGKGSGTRSIEIELEEYPKFIFNLGGSGLDATNVNSLVNNVQQGEKIEIKILKDQYQKKITKEVELGFWDKTINYRIIGIYGIKDKQNSYFSLEQFNRNTIVDRNSWSMYLLLGFSFSILGFGIFELVRNKKPEGKFNAG